MRSMYNIKTVIIDPLGEQIKEITNISLVDIENSFIVEDPEGIYFKKHQKNLQKRGFKINIINFTKENIDSLKYNPFLYVNNEEDACLLSESIVVNTKVINAETNPNDEFWKQSEKKLLECAIINECVVKNNNNINFKTIIDSLKNEKEVENIVKRSDVLKHLGSRTLSLTIRNCIIRLSSLSVSDENIKHGANKINLKGMLDNKSATFIIYPEGTQLYKALTNIMYSQLYTEDVKKKEIGGKISPITLFINEKSDNYKIINMTDILINAKNLNMGISLSTNNIESLLNKYNLREAINIFNQAIICKSEKTK